MLEKGAPCEPSAGDGRPRLRAQRTAAPAPVSARLRWREDMVAAAGPPQGPAVAPGRYRATLARVSGDKVTPVGQPQSFSILPIELK